MGALQCRVALDRFDDREQFRAGRRRRRLWFWRWADGGERTSPLEDRRVFGERSHRIEQGAASSQSSVNFRVLTGGRGHDGLDEALAGVGRPPRRSGTRADR